MKYGSILALAWLWAWTAAIDTAAAVDELQYGRDVLPILAENCFACHGFDKKNRQAGLRLDIAEGAVAELESGERAVVAGKPDESELIRRIVTDDADLVMPPRSTKKKLSDSQKRILKRWIEQGAPYSKHWSFEPPRQAAPPEVAGTDHPIDRFIRAKLAEVKLSPSPAAEPATLMKRVCLDLTGLPPTPAEVDAFAAAYATDADAAYRELVERLLASPHYGERFGRLWLDQARYADSNGYSIDAPRQIWKYRDWVIEAFNSDMPFDQFTIEQLAGDLLPGATESQKIATGFHRNTQINQEGGIDKEQFRIDSIFDRVATTGTVWLGLTIGCAQCHDHKFDPIEQKEYYQFFAFFNNQAEPTLKIYPAGVDPAALAKQLKAAEQKLTAYFEAKEDQVAAWENELSPDQRKKLPREATAALDVQRDKRKFAHKRALLATALGKEDSEFGSLNAEYAKIESKINGAVTTMVLEELPQPRKTTVFINGDFTRPADSVAPGTPAVLPPLENRTGKTNRLDLAQWIVSRENPLTARVLVNRVWQHYFGRGLVETENDFGLLGSPPTHPELLDWLACEFMQRGWSLKELQRLIVTSQTYRQSSKERPDLREKDSDNYLLGRQRRLRLDAEIVRDVALTASGLLSKKLGGPPVYPPIPDGVMGQGQVKHPWNVSKGEDRYRRGLYTFVYRATPPPALNVFDAPDGFSTCTRRNRSNTPLQALTLLNDAGFVEFATALEKLIRTEGLETAFRRCMARRPQPDELAVLQQLDPLTAARTLLNLDETVTRE